MPPSISQRNTRFLSAAIMLGLWISVPFLLLPTVPGWAQTDSPLLLDMACVQHKPGEITTADNTKTPSGTVQLADGQFGKACQFSLAASTTPQLFTAWVNPTENWDQYAGFSF